MRIVSLFGGIGLRTRRSTRLHLERPDGVLLELVRSVLRQVSRRQLLERGRLLVLPGGRSAELKCENRGDGVCGFDARRSIQKLRADVQRASTS